MNDLAKARDFPESASVFQRCNVYMPGQVRRIHASFKAALIEEKSTPLNFSYFSTQLSLKILAKQGKTAKKCLHFTVELFNLAKARDFPESASMFQ